MKDIAEKKLFGYFLVTIIVLFVLYFLLKRIGIIKSREPKEVRDARTKQIDTITNLNQMVIDFKESSLFNPATMNAIPFSLRMSYDRATGLAQDIENAWAKWYWPNDDENAIYKAFSSIDKQQDVSSIAYYYNQLFDRDLRSDIIDKMTNSEIRNIWTIIQSKPR